MRIYVELGKIEETPSEVSVVSTFEGDALSSSLKVIDKALGGAISEALKSKGFSGKLNQTLVMHTHGKLPAKRVLLVGLGKKAEFNLDCIRQAAASAAKAARELGIKRITTIAHSAGANKTTHSEATQATVEGTLLGLYQYAKYKTEKEDSKVVEELNIIENDEKKLEEMESAAKVAQALANAQNFVRDVTNSPGNEITPSALGEIAKKLAKEHKLKCTVLGRKEIEKLKMGAFLGVARGSAQEPKFIVIEYNGGKDTIVLVGKAITFDSGGISIKPAEKMEQMKYDKAGGVAVLGAIKAASELKLPLRVIALIPATENLPSGTALKPGDILTAMSGKTIEIISTDAEGRLILADALSYAAQYKPKAVVDIATLTGACVIALGSVVSGMMGNDEALKAKLKAAGEKSGERVWELPLYKEYSEQIKSDVADMKNVGNREAGAITAAAFLSKFVDAPWVHIDIAGTAYSEKDKPYAPKGASGVGVRLLAQFLMDWAKG